MSAPDTIRLTYFSDLLCIWAYISQVRVDELKDSFGTRIEFDYRFIPVFGAAEHHIDKGWRTRGGREAYAAHVQATAQKFPHIDVHPRVWRDDVPASSAHVHLFLKAVQHLIAAGAVPARDAAGCGAFEELMWRLRLAFFRDARNIARREVQFEAAAALGLPLEPIRATIDDGTAMAELCRDLDLCKELSVGGSPTYVLNEGRQKLYGNVGYKVIAANVQEILQRPEDQASWC
jgi:predicted DsbA family dithiol-disulfide isomerase